MKKESNRFDIGKMDPPTQEKNFNWYLEDFGLKTEDLKDKKILDIGSGTIPKFVSYCLENNITDQIYAVDRWSFGKERSFYTQEGRDQYNQSYLDEFPARSNFIQAEGKKLPISKELKFDYIFMRASIDQEQDTDGLIHEVLSYLGSGGQLRIAPLHKDWPETSRLREILLKLSDDFITEWRSGVVPRGGTNGDLVIITRK